MPYGVLEKYITARNFGFGVLKKKTMIEYIIVVKYNRKDIFVLIRDRRAIYD